MNLSSVLLILTILSVFLILINAKDLPNDVTTPPAPTSTLQRSTSEGFIPKTDGLAKRGVQITDLKSSDTIGVAAKSYDPPPEFYRWVE